MSRIDARNSAFGIVPSSLDGAVVTQDFPLFAIDSNVIAPQFLALLLRSHQFAVACQHASRGTTNRKRLKVDLFLDEKVPVPSLLQQRDILSLVQAVADAATPLSAVAKDLEELSIQCANYMFGE
jgi:restriction endonuclease S subunit